ncbi:GntR family transcriptional regulator [Fusibacter ferrireducens]|uniref:GntR family transcriptional regulator n=1 Tax=Fusibacter ferrireducens TaxID=2785058 RepID=A0ABR9ZT11_9FIRM|nr:GntR family transcriptional regulator [Fusibacter ferrireducens]MBF4693611.1 GntR family transcriptional regulator [Fusibacter ferrireducens]
MEFNNDLPIYQQIMNMIKYDIVSGKIPSGQKLLSTRDLAIKLKVNPNTIQRVYKELETEAVCQSKRGLGTFVTEDDEVILMMKETLVDDMVKTFIEGMTKLNYSRENIIDKINCQFEKGDQQDVNIN